MLFCAVSVPPWGIDFALVASRRPRPHTQALPLDLPPQHTPNNPTPHTHHHKPTTTDLYFLRAARVALADAAAAAATNAPAAGAVAAGARSGTAASWDFAGRLGVDGALQWLRTPPPRPAPDAPLAEKVAEHTHATVRRQMRTDLALVRQAAVTLVTSEAEADLLGRLAPGAPVAVVSNIYDASGGGGWAAGLWEVAGDSSSSSSSSSSGGGDGGGGSGGVEGSGSNSNSGAAAAAAEAAAGGSGGGGGALPCEARSGALFVGNLNHREQRGRSGNLFSTRLCGVASSLRASRQSRPYRHYLTPPPPHTKKKPLDDNHNQCPTSRPPRRCSPTCCRRSPG